MNEFVEECRREWRRLGVPDPVANEMAADLTADLDEAEAEGGSAEDVLGNSVFDARRFAASWAGARGVTTAPAPPATMSRRPPLAIALTALTALLTVGAGLVLLFGRRGVGFAFAARRFVAPAPQMRLALPHPPGPIRLVPPGPFFVGSQFGGVDVHPLAWVLLIVGVVGLGLAVLYWSPWSHGYRRRKGPPTPSWN